MTGRLLVCIAAWCFAQCAQALELDQLFKQVSPGVWLVKTFDKAGAQLAIGSAVVVEPQRLITNCHVLRSARSFVLQKDRESFKGSLEHFDLDRDLCLVAVADTKFSAPAVMRARGSSLSVGQRVIALGNPQGLETTLSDGLVSRLQFDEEDGLEVIQTSAPLSPGSSGGGLFDLEGRLIGITQGSVAAARAQNLNFALPADWLQGLPERSKLQLDEYLAKKRAKR